MVNPEHINYYAIMMGNGIVCETRAQLYHVLEELELYDLRWHDTGEKVLYGDRINRLLKAVSEKNPIMITTEKHISGKCERFTPIIAWYDKTTHLDVESMLTIGCPTYTKKILWYTEINAPIEKGSITEAFDSDKDIICTSKDGLITVLEELKKSGKKWRTGRDLENTPLTNELLGKVSENYPIIITHLTDHKISDSSKIGSVVSYITKANYKKACLMSKVVTEGVSYAIMDEDFTQSTEMEFDRD